MSLLTPRSHAQIRVGAVGQLIFKKRKQTWIEGLSVGRRGRGYRDRYRFTGSLSLSLFEPRSRKPNPS